MLPVHVPVQTARKEEKNNLDGGKSLRRCYAEMVNSILSIFWIITFHSIPSDQFQIGVDIFTFAKFPSYVIIYGYFRKLIIL